MPFNISPEIIWIIIAVIFAIIEGATMGLITIWFTIGAVLAAIAAFMGASIFVQLAIFLVSAVLLIFFARPIAEKKLKIGKEKTNASALIGKIGIVVKTIELHESGQVKIAGMEWTAITKDSLTSIEEGKNVEILDIEGVKLIVKEN